MVLPFSLRLERNLFLVLFTVVLATALLGQTAPEKTSASSTTVVKNVDEVSIDFVVRNKKKPVLDLKPDDVVVTDDGSAVKISDLRLVSGQSGVNHLISFVFDQLDPASATNARDAARKILKLIPPAEFSLAVFKMDRRLRLFQEFTTDRQQVEKAFDAVTSDDATRRNEADVVEKRLISAVQSGAGQGQSSSATSQRDLQQVMLAALTESQRILQDHHMQVPLAGLLGLVRAQTRTPGRKLVVYFTEGINSDADARDTIQSIGGAANRAEVSIYVIDKAALDTKTMDGLMAAMAMGNMASAGRSATMGQPAQSPLSAGLAAQAPAAYGPGMLSQISDQMTRVEGEGLAGGNNPLAAMTANTGGAYIFSEDNLKKPFRRAIADLTTYYQASYVPPGLVYNGTFHQTKVKALRRGLKVQARAGYFAVPPASGMRAFEAPMVAVLSQAQLPADVKFRAGLLQLGSLTTGNENTLVVEVPTAPLEGRSDPNANLFSWHVSVVSEVKDKSGAVVEHFSEDIPGHTALNAKDDAQNSATMQRHFALSPGQYTLETLVTDRNSGKMGGERSQFEVRSPASGPFLSDVAVVRQIDSSAEELDPFEPMRYQTGRVVPSLTDQVTPGTRQLSFFFLVHPDASIAEPAMLEMQVLRNGELLGQVPLQLPKDLSESFPYMASLNSGDLPAGNYAVRLSLTQGDRIVERENRFNIAGAELANAALGKTDPLTKNSDDGILADSVKGEAEINLAKRPPLVITPLPTDSVARPANEELDRIIEAARRNALNYSLKLPNFLCVELTDRSVDPAGNGKWRRKDSFGELLRYVDNKETRTTLEFNGQRSSIKRADLNGPISLGEFGHLLSLVFQPSSKTEFHWKETDALASGTVQVFDYRVDRKNDSLVLSDNSGRVYAGFHGLAYVDSSTLAIRRVTMEADDLPPAFSIHAASIAVDYDYVAVGPRDYLMPVRGTIRVKRGKREVNLNQIVFQDYRRYASQVKVIVKP